MPATVFLEHVSFIVSMPSEDFCLCNDAVKKKCQAHSVHWWWRETCL